MNNSQHLSQKWTHQHRFTSDNNSGERNTAIVLLLTLVTMIAEIIAGTIYGSMALLADGWHMGTHAAAFLITLFAYRYARKHADSTLFSYGTGKVSVLGGYTSAVALGLVAIVMLVESTARIFNPQDIHFNQAILVAIIGLVVNVVSVFLLKDHHSHEHGHSHSHSHSHSHNYEHEQKNNHHHGHEDHNLKAAYFHVLADALTSLLAIGALLLGKYVGLNWLDPVMGIVGAVIISRWAWGLMRQTGPILLDASMAQQPLAEVKQLVEQEGDTVVDLHVWKISADHFAASLIVVSQDGRDSSYFKAKLAQVTALSHVTVEVHMSSPA
ncbi:CDF family Co(II)/Ni(II) efflux transporter DmeF [Shewanella youngdeokensis]|uniref:CDF family Co(II)/Ni(II) efflux transporter DmeF n=1 Tax=Shewanella youngdeokensis TaxID=2999068 RepID=A0ABZ0K2C2_9GAMM|nr:CDF family Co(II)/Ni(II) efflux transporter DmeF [Shewanella sp. DAU334]